MVDLPADRVDLVVLEDRRVRGLLAREHDVEDRVQPGRAGQDAPELPLGNGDRMGMLSASVEDAGDQPRLAQALGVARASLLALLDLQTNAFAGHTGGEV